MFIMSLFFFLDHNNPDLNTDVNFAGPNRMNDSDIDSHSRTMLPNALRTILTIFNGVI